ncbi:hypothetical protein VTL71DRAFT_9130 [Oculimacula yallundae]|uniref:Uncharacterized protein n=1 Tax=Oculimacula yallundae TaxID=86028 RepID=A0ABR4BTV9_9HELO
MPSLIPTTSQPACVTRADRSHSGSRFINLPCVGCREKPPFPVSQPHRKQSKGKRRICCSSFRSGIMFLSFHSCNTREVLLPSNIIIPKVLPPMPSIHPNIDISRAPTH